MRFFVGITDRDWFAFLSHLNGIDEVESGDQCALRQQFLSEKRWVPVDLTTSLNYNPVILWLLRRL